jgi:WXG100 family type VII secretion target
VSINVRYDDLQRTATQLNTGREEMTAQLNKLKGLVDSLVSSGFVTDQASGRFQQSYQQWNTGASNAIQGLEGMTAFLNQAIARHQQLDSELGQAASAG